VPIGSNLGRYSHHRTTCVLPQVVRGRLFIRHKLFSVFLTTNVDETQKAKSVNADK